MTEDRLFKRRDQFSVVIGGEAMPSPLAKIDCGYFDWGFYRISVEGQLLGFTSIASSADRSLITVLVDGEYVELRINQTRLYVEPSYDRCLLSEGEDPPAAVMAWASQQGLSSATEIDGWLNRHHTSRDAPYRVIEYVLGIGCSYYAQVRHDHYSVPLLGGILQERTNPILHISDRPFDDLEIDTEPLPPFQGFVY
jgi:hypothetical protein